MDMCHEQQSQADHRDLYSAQIQKVTHFLKESDAI